MHALTQLPKKISKLTSHHLQAIILISVFLVIALVIGGFLYWNNRMHSQQVTQLTGNIIKLTTQLKSTSEELAKLKKEDQFVRNEKLQKEIKEIEDTYKDSVITYENLLRLKESDSKIKEFDDDFADILSLLAERNYTSASAQLAKLEKAISTKQSQIASAFTIPATVKENNSPPGSGYSQQAVKTADGTYLVSIIVADLNSTRVIVDTASEGDCKNDCPVDSLGSYAARSGAFAGINGPYFCPADYPSCADKKNSFDTLLMNKNKHYFNSDNNVYSTVPAVIFSGNSARFVTQSLQWGRDTGVDAVIAGQPLLIFDGNVVYGGDDEVKRAGKGTRAFIGASDSTVYIGVVYNANVAEVARVLKAMGMKNALNLDSGGSIAMWSNGSYIAGPGRNTPFGILFVRK